MRRTGTHVALSNAETGLTHGRPIAKHGFRPRQVVLLNTGTWAQLAKQVLVQAGQ